MRIGKYSFGTGDRFGHQGEAQLRALIKAADAGIEICPVWNKSNREHTYIHSKPTDTRVEADAAVMALGYTGEYYVDADHINLGNVQGFIGASNFFTLDVANKIGTASTPEQIETLKIYLPNPDLIMSYPNQQAIAKVSWLCDFRGNSNWNISGGIDVSTKINIYGMRKQ